MQRLFNLFLKDLLLLLALFLVRFAFLLSCLVLFIRSRPHGLLVSVSQLQIVVWLEVVQIVAQDFIQREE